MFYVNCRCTEQHEMMRDFRLTPRCKWDLRSSRILRRVDWYLVTDDSGQPSGPILKGEAVQEECLTFEDDTDRLSRNAGNCQSMLRNIPEERRSQHEIIPENKDVMLCKCNAAWSCRQLGERSSEVVPRFVIVAGGDQEVTGDVQVSRRVRLVQSHHVLAAACPFQGDRWVNLLLNLHKHDAGVPVRCVGHSATEFGVGGPLTNWTVFILVQ